MPLCSSRFRNILACPTCYRELELKAISLFCKKCGREYYIHEGCPIFLDHGVKFLPQEGPVSRNLYTTQSLRLIDKYKDGLVLDDGAGYPQENENFENVLQFEIVQYPTTDVVGNGERLPFRSNSFDAVISESVLEHVQNPFSYVSEIYRVLKPGGEIYCDSAFLQPVHAYPSHYFNTTLMALGMLFKDFNKLQSGVGPHQMPWVTLRWILNSYISGFRDEADRERFKKMKIADIADELNNHKNIDFYNELLNNSITELACGVNFCGSKPHSIFVRDVDRGIRCYEENGLIYTLDRIINYLKNS